jgi:hypothetical protein
VKSSTATLTVEDFNGRWINADTAAGDVTLTLPSAAASGAGYGGIIRKASCCYTLCLETQDGQTINGASSLAIGQEHQALLLLSDGANWFAFEWVYDGTVTASKLAATLIGDLCEVSAIDRANDYFMVQSNAECGLRKVRGKLIDKREPDSLHSLAVSPDRRHLRTQRRRPLYRRADPAGGGRAMRARCLVLQGQLGFIRRNKLVWVSGENLLYVCGPAGSAADRSAQIGVTSPEGTPRLDVRNLTLSGARSGAGRCRRRNRLRRLVPRDRRDHRHRRLHGLRRGHHVEPDAVRRIARLQRRQHEPGHHRPDGLLRGYAREDQRGRFHQHAHRHVHGRHHPDHLPLRPCHSSPELNHDRRKF